MSKKDDFFIGWSADTPNVDRRFLLGASVLFLGGAAGIGSVVASKQDPVGNGTWDQGDLREWRGIITSAPYPMLRYRDDEGMVRTALLGCMNKCAVKLRIDQMAEGPVIVRGSPIRRDNYLMIATNDFGEWIEAADGQDGDDALVFPEPEPLGDVALNGMILDTKCWFGAMRPNEGKVHKACASLCIRGGIPPAFYARAPKDQSRLLIMTDSNGAPLSEEILPFVADAMRLSGSAERRGDLLFLRTAVSTFARI